MENLRKLRLERRMSQMQVQKETGINQGELSKYERGQTRPTMESLLILASYFHTSLDYLMGLTDERTPYPRKKET